MLSFLFSCCAFPPACLYSWIEQDHSYGLTYVRHVGDYPDPGIAGLRLSRIAWYIAGVVSPARGVQPGDVSNGSPWRCFWTGLVAAVGIALPAIILINLPLGLLKFMGWSLMGLGLGLSVFGAAGLAGLMASRIKSASPGTPTEFGTFVRAAVMIELAAIFPLLGWLAFFPISLLISLGAALLTWLRGAPAPAKDSRLELAQAGTGAQA